MSQRTSGRGDLDLRPISLEAGVSRHAEGSCLARFGDTQVLCMASVEDRVPPHVFGTGAGWVTAEYGMLPRSTHERMAREAAKGKQGGRTLEIQRLIGRALRAAVDLRELGPRTLTIDCDVIQADGGTRTAAITGGFVALVLAIRAIKGAKKLGGSVVKRHVAAVSVGVLDGAVRLDLDYGEDSTAEVDMNVVATGEGELVEVQGTAEKKASAYACFAMRYALADDSGLCVDALGGAPGVHSARWSELEDGLASPACELAGAADRELGDELSRAARDEANNEKLLRALQGREGAQRDAAYVAVLALAAPDGRILTAVEGSCRGRIGHVPLGKNGFGYDPLFVPEAEPARLEREVAPAHALPIRPPRTMAELGPAEKDALSHRGAAFRALRPVLEQLAFDKKGR